MEKLSQKQLANLTVEQLDEIRRETGHSIAYLEEEFRQFQSKADYTRKRNLEQYLVDVKAVLQHKIKTGQK